MNSCVIFCNVIFAVRYKEYDKISKNAIKKRSKKGKRMDYSKLKIGELKEIAKEKGLRNISALKKGELVELLSNVDQMINRPVAKKQPENDNASLDVTKAEKAAKEKNEDKSEKKSNPEKIQKVEKVDGNNSKQNTEDKNAGKAAKPAKKVDGAKGAKKPAVKKSDNASGNNSGNKKNADRRAKDSKKGDPKNQNQAEKSSDKQMKSDIQTKSDNKNNESKQGQKQAQKPTQKQAKKVVQKPEARRAPVKSENEVNEQVDSANAAAEVKAADTQAEENNAIKVYDGQEYNANLASGEYTVGILEVLPEGYGFIRSDNYLPGEKDIYIAPAQIRRFGLKTGDVIRGPIKQKMGQNEKFRALLYIEAVNGMFPSQLSSRMNFEDMTPIFPNERINLDYNNAPVSLRIVDLFSPIGKGQRGMIVSPPKAGKTTLLKQIAKRISVAYPDMNLLVLLIDERPEEVTDIRESIEGPNAEVIYSTFDELPEHHKKVSEMVIERAKRLVESKKDVVILIDSITRLSRAYNLTVPPSGRTLSGGLDPAALHMPKKFFGAARNMREGGSLTILATALIDTGSRMDDVVFEEFKGTGNMELVLDRNLSEKRVFPAIDIAKSGTRKDDLLLSKEEQEVLDAIHAQLRGLKSDEVTEDIVKIFSKTRNNREFLEYCRKIFIRR